MTASARGVLLLAMAFIWSATALAQTPAYFPADQYGNSTLYNPQSGGPTYESILSEVPQFEPLSSFSDSDPYKIAAKPIGRLDILIESSTIAGGRGVYSCTASVISEYLILTNAHCIPGKPGDRVIQASILMGYYSDTDSSGEERFTVATVPEDYNAKLDYSIVRVFGNPAARWGSVDLYPVDPEPGASVVVIQHPGGRPKQVARRCAAGPIRGNSIFHKCDTLPGSSGSPLLQADLSGAIGLHHAGNQYGRGATDAYNYAIRLQSIISNSRMFPRSANAQASSDPQPDPSTSAASSSGRRFTNVTLPTQVRGALEGCRWRGTAPDWRSVALANITNETWHVIVASMPMGGSQLQAELERARRARENPAVDFDLMPSISQSGGNQRWAIVVASGLRLSSDAQIVVRYARNCLSVPDAFAVKQTPVN